MDTSKEICAQLLQWPVRKLDSGLRAYVVEPALYDPPMHTAIFNAALTTLASPGSAPRLDPNTSSAPKLQASLHFDLLTFPEAFLPAPALVEALESLSGLKSFGCVHVGLRPNRGDDNHLFETQEAVTLVAQLEQLRGVCLEDFAVIREWIGNQTAGQHFNFGCLFCIDVAGRLRICLHPKMVRSQFELSVEHERTMVEANLVSLVTLLPENQRCLSMTIQPLICSDALALSTDRGHLPMDCINQHANDFASRPPDHIDVVSVVSCTPQQKYTSSDGGALLKWHQDFRSAFVRLGEGAMLPRHNHSVVILSNFRTLRNDSSRVPSKASGGLSGVFLPISRNPVALPAFAQLSSYGRAEEEKGADNGWSDPGTKALPGRQVRGYLVQLSPDSEPMSDDRMMGFTINRLPREDSRWKPIAGVYDIQLHTARREAGSEAVSFVQREP